MAQIQSFRFIENSDRDRFELWDDDVFLGLIGYERHDGVYTLMHTVIEEDFSRKGIARLLVSLVLTRLRLDGLRIVAMCSYVQRYLERFPEYQAMVARSVVE